MPNTLWFPKSFSTGSVDTATETGLSAAEIAIQDLKKTLEATTLRQVHQVRIAGRQATRNKDWKGLSTLMPILQTPKKTSASVGGTIKSGVEISRFWVLGGQGRDHFTRESNAIKRYDTNTRIHQTLGATLSLVCGYMGNMQSPTKGYRAGSRLTNANTNTIDRLTYEAPETCSRVGAIVYAAVDVCGKLLGDSLKGYICGGATFPPVYAVPRRDAYVFDFLSETNQNLGTPLDSGRYTVSGASDQGKGMFVGSTAWAQTTTSVGAIDFSTNTFSSFSSSAIGNYRAPFSLPGFFYVSRGIENSLAKISFTSRTESQISNILAVGNADYSVACGGLTYAYINNIPGATGRGGNLFRFSDAGTPTSETLGSGLSNTPYGAYDLVADGSPSF